MPICATCGRPADYTFPALGPAWPRPMHYCGEHQAAHAQEWHRYRDEITHTQAAAIYTDGITYWQKRGIRPGDPVLIAGGSLFGPTFSPGTACVDARRGAYCRLVTPRRGWPRYIDPSAAHPVTAD